MNEKDVKAAAEACAKLTAIAERLMRGNYCISQRDLGLMIGAKAEKVAKFIEGYAGAQPAATPTTDVERFKRFLTIRHTGIEFQRYFSPHFVRLVGAFVNPARDKNQNHVYELQVKESASRPGRWIAKGTNDGRELFTLTCASKWNAERYGFGALRSYLTRHLRRTIKANKSKEGK